MNAGLTRNQWLKALVQLLLPLTPAVIAGENRTRLPADHPEVYYSYFLFVNSLNKWRTEQPPERQAELSAAMARYLRVDLNELPKLIKVCEETTKAFEQMRSKSMKDSSAQNLAHPSSRSLSSELFKVERQEAIQIGVMNLERALSPASWKSVRQYINGPHRESVRAIR